MTMHDLENGGKHGRDPSEIDLKTTSALPASSPPTYDEGADQSMLDSFKHVSIPPPAPPPDERAVDIVIEDNIKPIDEQPTKLNSAESPYMTPHRASEEVLQRALSTACHVIGFSKIELPEFSKLPTSQRSNSLSSSMDNSNASIPNLPLPALTIEDMLEALPHRSALFLPEIMEWFILIPEQEIRKGGKVDETVWPPLDIPPEVSSTLWRMEGGFKIPIEEQAGLVQTISSVDDEKFESIEYFDCWRNTKLRSRLMNKKGSLPSVLPWSLLEQFRSERRANPRPGSNGEIQFREAITMLIKIVGNAANGETRALSITGKALTNKLGFDNISEKILGILGFEAEGKPDEDGKYGLIKPPDMTQKIKQIKLRRAWLEIALWYQYRQMPSSVEAFWNDLSPSIPLRPELGSARSFLESSFEYDRDSQHDTRFAFVRPLVNEALRLLGADNEASEEVVEECYLANTIKLSKAEQLPFYGALQKIGHYLSEMADGSDEIIHTRLALEKSRGLFSEAELKSAFARFGLEVESLEHANSIAEEFILDVYMSAVSSVAGNKEEVQKKKEALDIISASRDRPIRMEEQVAASVELSIDKAYEILGVSHETDDGFISSVYSVVVVEGARTAAECTEALRIIAEARNSATLKKVYRNAIGEEEEWQPADLAIPIGLNNIGNTCYLNSVLQYFFAIGKLREQVMLASREDVEEVKKVTDLPVVRVGGRQVSQREIDRSNRFVRQLGQLFSNMTSAPTSAVTPERELAYLALVSSRVEETNKAEVDLQIISASPEMETTHLTRPTSDLQLAEKQDEITERLQVKPRSSDESMMVHEAIVEENAVEIPATEKTVMEETHADELSSTEADGIVTPPLPESSVLPPLPPRPLAVVAGFETHDAGQQRISLMQLGAQQDVSECLDNVMFQIEVALTAAEQNIQQATAKGKIQSAELDDGWIEDGDLLRRLFLGRTLQRLELASPINEGDQNVRGPSIHIKREVFTILPIDVVEEEKDIYDGLDGFFEEEILTGSAGEPIRRTVTLTDAPAIMQIQLQRVQYDRIKGVYKSQAHLEVGQTLYMDRYLDFNPLESADVVRLEKRKKGREARKRIAELRERLRALEPERTPIWQTLKQTSSFLSSLASSKGKSKVKQPQQQDGEEEEAKEYILDTLLDEGFSEFLSEEAHRVEEEAKEAQKEIFALKSSIEELWKDEKRMEYILASVFMHRGEASHGHYFLNQRKLTSQDEEPSSTWYKYNDQTVTEVTWSDVHRDQSGATPYLLCWLRRDKLDHFDTLCRKYETSPIPSQWLKQEETIAGGEAQKVTEDMTNPAKTTSTQPPEPVTFDTLQQTDDTIMTDLPAQ